MHHVRRARPDVSNKALAELLGVNESTVRRYGTQRRMRLDTADRILTVLDLNYLLTDGTLTIETSKRKHAYEKYKEMRAERDYWKARAERLGAVLYPPSPPLTCKDFVRSLDSGEPNW